MAWYWLSGIDGNKDNYYVHCMFKTKVCIGKQAGKSSGQYTALLDYNIAASSYIDT